MAKAKILKIIGGVAVAVVFFFATLVAIEWFGPAREVQKPDLAQKPPLPEATRQSIIIAPVAIPIVAIREAMEQAAPRNLSGVPNDQISKLLAKADIGFMLERSPLTLIGRADGLTIATNLNGSIRASGQLPAQIGSAVSGLLSERDKERITGALSGILKEKDREKLANLGKESGARALDQRADVKGDVHVVARPTITTAWRVEPNLVGQVKLAEANVQIAGVKVNAASEIKSMIDRAMSEQMLALGTRLRNDPFVENAARREWAKLCRSVALNAPGANLPPLFLELRPTRAFAAQPRVDANNVTLTLGIQADTRVVPQETKPDCPFPAKLDLVPPLDQGKVTIGLPVDVPLSEIGKLLETQLKDKVFPDDRASPAEIVVLRASASAAGDRLLISLLVKARERASWFGLGTEATVHIAGKPVLDQNQQIVRLENISLAVESDALFGLIGAAAKAGIGSLQKALERNAVIDLKPAIANARRSIERALSEFRQNNDDVKVDATVTNLRMVGIEFDSNIVRVTVEADGIARVALTRLPVKQATEPSLR
ncbi:MAG: DUF4403 family protein [Pseudorhodoplanes sp.]